MNTLQFPRCGTLWLTVVAASIRSCRKHLSQSGCSANCRALICFHTGRLYHARQGRADIAQIGLDERVLRGDRWLPRRGHQEVPSRAASTAARNSVHVVLKNARAVRPSGVSS